MFFKSVQCVFVFVSQIPDIGIAIVILLFEEKKMMIYYYYTNESAF